MSGDERFRPHHRISKRREFERVYRQGLLVKDDCFRIFALSKEDPLPRLGLSVSQKAAKKAVTRNRLKRVIREWFRTRKGALEGLDLIVQPKRAAAELEHRALRERLDELAARLPSRTRKR